MNIDITAHQMSLTDDVKEYAKEKISKLSKYGIDIINVNIILEENRNKEEPTIGQARATFSIPGKDIFVHGEGVNVFAAIDDVEKKAGRQLKKRKGKFNTRKKLRRSKEIARKLFRR